MQALHDHCVREARAGRLAYQLCRSCGHSQIFPRPFCRHCGKTGMAWLSATGNGIVVAHSVLHRAPTPIWRGKLPYAVALVELTEGMRVMGHAALGLRIGEQVIFSFVDHGDRCLLHFDPLEQEPQ